jgi:alanine dehydrogenase
MAHSVPVSNRCCAGSLMLDNVSCPVIRLRSGHWRARVNIGAPDEHTSSDGEQGQLDGLFNGRAFAAYSAERALEGAVRGLDLAINGVLTLGARRSPRSVPVRVHRHCLHQATCLMIDCSIGQGGYVETSRPATYAVPISVADGVPHAVSTNLSRRGPGRSCRRPSTQPTHGSMRTP